MDGSDDVADPFWSCVIATDVAPDRRAFWRTSWSACAKVPSKNCITFEIASSAILARMVCCLLLVMASPVLRPASADRWRFDGRFGRCCGSVAGRRVRDARDLQAGTSVLGALQRFVMAGP